ncbi:MAG: hypothetical protein E6H01_10990 [Bacillati bacterium ANGP1]|uniref:Heme-copper oxidase subunit III family profile domain-containing protein n=1 Tax=Candidatus Segetimicrobium genomatis TaxID=2569760 RepID=A0A537KUM9_9BACT|nr:MAG: hypothetical protein E6H01_10990 [Terrabacteria group bacterium ANGP1]
MPAPTRTLERPPGVQEPGGPATGGHGPRGSGGGEEAASRATTPARIAVWLLVGAITALFAAFTSTYLVRRGETDWQVGPLPPVLWLTTALILASSIALQQARRHGRRGEMVGLHTWLVVTTLLGLAFLAGQLLAWRQLATTGIYLATNPHSSFFYLLTGAHGLHLTGGIGALLYAVRRAPAAETASAALDVTDPVATYWHFLTGLWIYLFVILFAL